MNAVATLSPACRGRTLGLLCCCAAIMLIAVLPADAMKVTPPPRDRQVDAAIRRAQAWLEKQQQDDGSWQAVNERYLDGGTTALATLALVRSGAAAEQSSIARALSYLKSLSPDRTNTRCLRTMLYAHLGRDAQLQLDDDVRWLTSHQRQDGGWAERAGGEPSTTFETALAVLALTDARQVGASIPADLWQRAAEFLAESQNVDGGFGYYPPGARPVRVRGMSHASATAAAAGAAGSLLREGQGVALAVQHAALAWLAKHYTVNHVTDWVWGDRPDCAYRYLLGRASQTSSPLVIDGHAVDNDLARWLVERQRRDGRYGGQPLAESDVVATAWSLLTLAEVRRPLLLNRMVVGKRPATAEADLARVAAWATHELGFNAAWRELPASAPVSLLRQAPLLVITGAGAFETAADTREAIGQYLQAGGTVVVVPGGDAVFSRTADEFFRALGEGYRSESLPADHPLFDGRFRVAGLEVMAVGDRGRKRVFVLPTTLAAQWQAGYAEATADAFRLFANLALFATGGTMSDRKFEPTLQRSPDVEPQRFIDIGRLIHGGDWDASREASQALSRSLAAAISVGVLSRDVRPNQDIPLELTMLWLTGSKLDGVTPAHRDNIREYLDAGGMLLVDAAYGDEAFYKAATRQIELLYGAEALKPLPIDHPLLTGRFAGNIGSDITTVAYSSAARRKLGRDEGSPQLIGIERNGRIVAVLSPLGIAGPAEGEPPYDVIGYMPDDARRIALNVLLYAYAARNGALAE